MENLPYTVWRCSDGRQNIFVVARCRSRKVAELVLDFTLANAGPGVSAYIEGEAVVNLVF